ncbi:MAG: alpha/beta fold hydrolase [Burkholderiales bacterium]|nr:MAG: alpha/beta fold hydrolase [Burkholderiales bacterium]
MQVAPHNETVEIRVRSNGLTLCARIEGPTQAPPILLIMGLGMQLVAWPEPFRAPLIAAGFRVVSFDNRDSGLSTPMDHLGTPDLFWASLRYSLRMKVNAPYRLEDMAADTLGLLDALELERAHVVAVSMGGMIGQILAAVHPERVASFSCLMSSSGSRQLPGPTLAARAALLRRPRNPRNVENAIDTLEHLMRVIGSPRYPTEPAELRAQVAGWVRRAYRPAGTIRQLVAIAASGDRSGLLSQVRAPTLVVHGLLDPLIPVAAGRDLARRIPGARLEVIEGMGHDLPPALLPQLAELVLEHVVQSSTRPHEEA